MTLMDSLKLLSTNNILAAEREETSTEITRHGKFPVSDLNKVNDCRSFGLPFGKHCLREEFSVKIQHFIFQCPIDLSKFFIDKLIICGKRCPEMVLSF